MLEVVHFLVHTQFEQEAEVSFSCEKIPKKRKFYSTVVDSQFATQSCQFTELCDLSKGVLPCSTHGKQCRVAMHDFLFGCGFSCKDLSALKPAKGNVLKKHILATGTGTSGLTFKAVLKHCSRALPKVILLENVNLEDMPDNKSEDDECEKLLSNIEFLYSSLEELGYVVGHDLLKSSDYGLPQVRKPKHNNERQNFNVRGNSKDPSETESG